MRNTKREVAAAIQTMPMLIEETVGLIQQAEALAERISQNRAAIKETMVKHQITRQPTANGFEALLIDKQTFSWNVQALQGLLSDEQFEALCPNKAEGEKLRKLLEGSDADFAKKLRSCAKGSKRVDLELRPPAAQADAAVA